MIESKKVRTYRLRHERPRHPISCADGFRESCQEAITALTDKEFKVALLLAKSKTVKDIATLFNLSTRTIDAHRYNIHKKLNIHGVVTLTHVMVAAGFVGIGDFRG